VIPKPPEWPKPVKFLTIDHSVARGNEFVELVVTDGPHTRPGLAMPLVTHRELAVLRPFCLHCPFCWSQVLKVWWSTTDDTTMRTRRAPSLVILLGLMVLCLGLLYQAPTRGHAQPANVSPKSETAACLNSFELTQTLERLIDNGLQAIVELNKEIQELEDLPASTPDTELLIRQATAQRDKKQNQVDETKENLVEAMRVRTAACDAGPAPTPTALPDPSPTQLPILWPNAAEARFTSGAEGLSATFDASASTSPQGDVDEYLWSFGDGKVAKGKTVNHTYPNAGSFDVTLIVIDLSGAVGSATHSITVTDSTNNSPTASFTWSGADLEASFDAGGSTDEDGSITEYAWDFGEGSAAGTGVEATHTYKTEGTYRVVLTVTDDAGATSSVNDLVSVTSTSVPPDPQDEQPGPTNTGVPSVIPLQRHNGNLIVNENGAVVDGLDIHGNLEIKASNVTVQNTRVRGDEATENRVLVKASDSAATGFTIRDSTIAPDFPTVYHLAAIRMGNNDQTVERVDMSRAVDGITVQGDNLRIESSWIHDLRHYPNDPQQGGGPSHDDGIQIQRGDGIDVLKNYIEGPVNTAIQITQDAGPTNNVRINDGWMRGGSCTVNIAKKNKPNMTGMQINDNYFYEDSTSPGCAMIFNESDSDLVPLHNVYPDGSPAGIKSGG
jgi:PKD repeat protein